MKTKTIFVLIFLMFSSMAKAKNFTATYFEARKVFKGNHGPWMSAYSDLAVFLPMYSSGKEFGIEGQYNVAGPFSIGAKYLVQYPEWSDRDNYLLGPSFQVKVGNAFVGGLVDFTLRFVPLVDVEKGEFGRHETYFITVIEYSRIQLIPGFFYFHTKDFVWDSSSDQYTLQAEVAAWLYRRYIGLLTRPEYTNVESFDKHDNKVADIKVFTFPFGFKSEIPVGPVTFWGQLSVGPQWHSEKDDTGSAVFFTAGGRF